MLVSDANYLDLWLVTPGLDVSREPTGRSVCTLDQLTYGPCPRCRIPSVAAILEREIKLVFRERRRGAQGRPCRRRRAAAGPPAPGRLPPRHARRSTAAAPVLLRVRMECGKTLLTFKGPVQSSPMKLREEMETVVGDGPPPAQVLEELGFPCGSATRNTAKSSRTRT